jgi:hypothetical protein
MEAKTQQGRSYWTLETYCLKFAGSTSVAERMEGRIPGSLQRSSLKFRIRLFCCYNGTV